MQTRAAKAVRAGPVVPLVIFKVLLVIGVLAAAAFFGYQQLVAVDPERLPTPTQIVVPDPPDVDFRPPNPVP